MAARMRARCCKTHCNGWINVAWDSCWEGNYLCLLQLDVVNRIGVAASRLRCDLPADSLNFGAGDFPLKHPFKKCFNTVLFSLWRRDPVLELQLLLQLYARKLLCAQKLLCVCAK